MESFALRISRRWFLGSALTAAGLLAEGSRGTTYPSVWRRYSDELTELDVFRLTDLAFSSTLPAYYSRAIAKNSGFLLYGCDRSGSPQVFRMDLKSGATRELTEVENLDVSSITLTPDNRHFCYFAARTLFMTPLATMRERELYQVPEGWERCAGMTVGPDGTHATFAERRGDGSRLRMVSLVQGPPRTVIEAPFAMRDPIPRPMRAQVLYRQEDQALWLVNSDGQQNRQLKVSDGRIGPANWAPDGKTLLYLSFPSDKTQLNTIRELTPDSNADRLVAKTSQFVDFGFNRDTSVFVGASGNIGSPAVLLLLRVSHRELTLCEHRSSHPNAVTVMFSPDSQRVYFQSDWEGHPAIYCMHVDRLVEKTDAESG